MMKILQIIFTSVALLLAIPSSIVASGGIMTYTDSSGLNPRSSPAYVGGYVVEKFTTSGVFVVPGGVTTVDYLVVAGGGGGGVCVGSGGGAGGMKTGTFTVTSSSYPVVIGAGGSAGICVGGTGDTRGGDGYDSSIATVVSSLGGGGGGGSGQYDTAFFSGRSGGSGGGGTFYGAGGSGTIGEGNSGGSGVFVAGGGGGGGASTSGGSLDGGEGKTSSISGMSVAYAGGGGGSIVNSSSGGLGGAGGGGAGGGGNGTVGYSNASNGSDNSGGGGGGYYFLSDFGSAGTGGSGIVIVRYPYTNPTGTVSVATNIPTATWTLAGPTPPDFDGIGGTILSSQPAEPTTYTIKWDLIPGYKTPEIDNEKTLATGETIVFNGIYVATQIDLTAGSTYPVNVITDAPTLFYSVITNGGIDATGASFPNFFQVATSTGGVGIIEDLTSKTMPALGAGASAVASSTPYTFTTGGTYYVRSCADKTASADGGVITESGLGNEDNNCGEWTSINVIETSLLPEVINATSTNITAISARLGAEVTSFGRLSDGTLGTAMETLTNNAGPSYSSDPVISPDGKSLYLITADYTFTLFSRDINTGQIIEKVEDYNTSFIYPTDIAISPDGNSVYVTSWESGSGECPATPPENSISRYKRDPSSGKLTDKIDYPTCGSEEGIVISPDGTSVYTASHNGSVHLFPRNPVTGELYPKVLYSTSGGYPTDIIISHDGRSVYVATTFDNRGIYKYTRSLINGTLSARSYYSLPSYPQPDPKELAISLGGESVYVTTTGTTTYRLIRNTTTGVLSGRTDYLTTPNMFRDISISKDGNSVYVAGTDGNIAYHYPRNTNGTLDDTNKTQYSLFNSHGIVVTPDDRFLYVYDNGSPKKIRWYQRIPDPTNARGVCYGTMATPDLTNGATCVASTPATIGAYAVNVTGLQQGTTYNYRGYATNSHDTVYTSPTGSFTTAINGVCGGANGVASFDEPSTNFCNTGNSTAVTGIGTSQWIWECNPINNDGVGTIGYCSATNLNFIPGVCGSANGTPTPTEPTNLCEDGSSSTPTNDGTTWSWTCSGSGGGGTVSCSAQSAIKIKYRMF